MQVIIRIIFLPFNFPYSNSSIHVRNNANDNEEYINNDGENGDEDANFKLCITLLKKYLPVHDGSEAPPVPEGI